MLQYYICTWNKPNTIAGIRTSIDYGCWNLQWQCVMFAFDIGKRLRRAFGNTTNIEKEICSLFPHTQTQTHSTRSTRGYVSVLCCSFRIMWVLAFIYGYWTYAIHPHIHTNMHTRSTPVINELPVHQSNRMHGASRISLCVLVISFFSAYVCSAWTTNNDTQIWMQHIPHSSYTTACFCEHSSVPIQFRPLFACVPCGDVATISNYLLLLLLRLVRLAIWHGRRVGVKENRKPDLRPAITFVPLVLLLLLLLSLLFAAAQYSRICIFVCCRNLRTPDTMVLRAMSQQPAQSQQPDSNIRIILFLWWTSRQDWRLDPFEIPQSPTGTLCQSMNDLPAIDLSTRYRNPHNVPLDVSPSRDTRIDTNCQTNMFISTCRTYHSASACVGFGCASIHSLIQ